MKQNTDLPQLLSLEQLEMGLYRGQSWDLGFRALFGGQVMGQALSAAQQTVEAERVVHSFHSYFLLPGDASLPVIYDVENIRDGRSFSSRRVKAIQKGKVIFYMSASFQIPEKGLEHLEAVMPDAPLPETLEPDIKFYEKMQKDMPESSREQLSYHKPIDIRTVQTFNPLKPKPAAPVRYVWMKLADSSVLDLATSQRLLAYASDYYFLLTALQPHGLSIMNKQLRMATIDHAMWFHHDFDFSQWLLYCMDSPFSGGSRALVRGQFFNQQGKLVGSTMQEGLMRKLDE